MTTETKQILTEEEKAILVMLPLWDSSVWDPLQKKQYKIALDNFYELLGYYTRSTIKNIAWGPILNGDKAVRGIITKEEWENNVLPYLGFIILDIADKNFFEYIYSVVDAETLLLLHTAIIEQIPGESPDEKFSYTAGKREWLGDYFLASPISVYFNGPIFTVSEKLSQKNIDGIDIEKRLNQMPIEMRSAFFSTTAASFIRSFCESYGFSKQNTTDFAYVIGATLLNFISLNDFEDVVEKSFEDVLKGKNYEFVREARRRFIKSHEEEIEDLKNSIESVITETEKVLTIKEEEPEKEGIVKINKVSFLKAETPELPKRDENAPLILHKEDVDRFTSPGEKTSVFSKGFSSFGFFKRKETKPTVSATPTQPLVSTISSETKVIKPATEVKVIKTTPSIFERMRTENETPEKIVGEKKELETTPSPAPKILEIETKENPEPQKTAEENKKTVHYSTYKTDLPTTPGKEK